MSRMVKWSVEMRLGTGGKGYGVLCGISFNFVHYHLYLTPYTPNLLFKTVCIQLSIPRRLTPDLEEGWIGVLDSSDWKKRHSRTPVSEKPSYPSSLVRICTDISPSLSL